MLEPGSAAQEGIAKQYAASDRPKTLRDMVFVGPNHALEELQNLVLENITKAAGVASEEDGYFVELGAAYSNRTKMTMVFILNRTA